MEEKDSQSSVYTDWNF